MFARRSVRTIASVATCSTVVAGPIAAQEVRDSATLDDITITATRLPVPQRDLAATVTVLDGEALRARGIRSLADALRSVPGVSVVESGSFGGVTTVFMRGGESDYVQVLVDGVAVNEPGGAYDLAHLTTDNVERIEVLRGPGSVLYGSDATAGVIQVITRSGAGAPALAGGVTGGTHGSVRFDADLTGGADRVRYAVGVSRFTTDGVYEVNNEYDNTVVSGRVQLRPDDATDLAFALRYHDGRYDFPTDGSGNVVDDNAFSLNEATTLSLEAGRFLTDRVEARVLLASSVTATGLEDAQDGPADTLGFYAFRSRRDLSRRSVDLRTNVYPFPGVTLTAGAQVEQQEERGVSEGDSQFGPSFGSNDDERSNRGYYAQVVAERSGLSFIAGARLDDNEAFGTFETFRAAAAYRTPWGAKLMASAGKSFKAPTFFENYATGFVVGNPDLLPERSVAWEAGFRQELLAGRASVGVTYFDQRFRDLIQFTFETSPNYENVAEADAAGLEVEGRIDVRGAFLVAASYTYLDTEVMDAGFDVGDGATFVEGARLLRRPTHAFTVDLQYVGWERGAVSARLHHVGNRDDRDFSAFPATPVVLPAYTTLDVAGRVRVFSTGPGGAAVLATVKVENALDEAYESIQGFPGRGRVVFVGARVGR